MDVVGMRMLVRQRLVAVRVSVGNLCELLGRVLVLVMLVMLVDVGMLERLVRVNVIVGVRGEQQSAAGHAGQRE